LTFVFFVHLYWSLLGASELQRKEKENTLQTAGMQMVLIGIMTFFYFEFRPRFLRWPPNILGNNG
jgi:hypothetical protein